MLQARSRILPALFATVCPLLAQVYPGGYIISIKPDPPLANAVAGVAYNLNFTATGGVIPYTWSVASGALPPGLRLNPSTGTMDGAPTGDGVFPFTLQVSDLSKVTAVRSYTITVKPALTIATSSPLSNGTVRVGYSATFSANGGWPPYTWSTLSALPAGLTLNPTSGVLSGAPTAVGSFTFGVKVSDSYQFSASKQFSLTVQSVAQLQTSVGSLAFSAGVAGDSPVSQSFLVTTLDQSAARFSVQVEGGSPNTPAPAWISVQPRAGMTPARVSVNVNPVSLLEAAYSARVLIISADGTQTVALPVTFMVDARPPALEVIPNYLRLAAASQTTEPIQTTLLVHNAGGGGPISFQASVSNPAWLTVEPASETTSPDSYTLLRVTANPLGLQRDAYRGFVRIISSAGNVEVPVAFVLRESGPALALSSNGIRFDLRQGQGAGNTQTVNILNVGDSTAHW